MHKKTYRGTAPSTLNFGYIQVDKKLSKAAAGR